MPPPAGDRPAADGDDTACWQVARQLRSDYPAWSVIWAARKHQYCAYPLFRTRRQITVTAAQPADLAAQMNEIQQAAHAPRAIPPCTTSS